MLIRDNSADVNVMNVESGVTISLTTNGEKKFYVVTQEVNKANTERGCVNLVTGDFVYIHPKAKIEVYRDATLELSHTKNSESTEEYTYIISVDSETAVVFTASRRLNDSERILINDIINNDEVKSKFYDSCFNYNKFITSFYSEIVPHIAAELKLKHADHTFIIL